MARPTSDQSGFAKALAHFWLGVIILVVLLGLFSSYFGWPLYLELLSHFQPQYFILSAISVVGLGLLRDRPRLLIGLGLTAMLATQVVPWYLPPRWAHPTATDAFRILISNVNYQNRQYDNLLAFVRDTEPDLALFMEIDPQWVEALKTLREELPYAAGDNRSVHRGIVLYSRYPLTDVRLRQFSKDSELSILGTVALGDQNVAFVATHPLPPTQPDYFHSRNRQLDQASQYLAAIAAPKMLLGDLNITMWSPYYRRLVRQAGLTNARDGFGVRPSWPTINRTPLLNWMSGLLTIPIDHVLVSADLQVTGMQIGPNVGSDHRPVVVDVRI